jgi:hypothetical protein
MARAKPLWWGQGQGENVGLDSQRKDWQFFPGVASRERGLTGRGTAWRRA